MSMEQKEFGFGLGDGGETDGGSVVGETTSGQQQGGRVENGDGTVTISLEFDIDPSVAGEMAKAMPKGQTREDQADVELGEGDEGTTSVQQQDGDGVAGVEAQDEGPKKARKADTPLENCRAKDPMYCPYHGTLAMTKSLQDEFKSRGIDGTVEVTGKGSHFKVSFTVPMQDEQTALAIVDNGLLSKKGISKTSNQEMNATLEGVESKFEADGKIAHEEMAAPPELLGEWVDNIIDKLATEPDLKKEVTRKDFIDMIVKVGEMHTAVAAAEKDPNDDNLKAAADAAYQQASAAVDVVTAMMDYKDVKSEDDAKALSDGYQKTIDDAKATYAPIDQEVKAKKIALFGPRGAFPPGFANANPWAGVRLSATLSDYSPTGKMLSEAEAGMRAAYGSILGTGKRGSDELDYAGRKALRCALQKLESAADQVAGHAARNTEKSKDLIAKLDAWHQLNPNGVVKAPKAPKQRASRARKATGTTAGGQTAGQAAPQSVAAQNAGATANLAPVAGGQTTSGQQQVAA